MTVSVNPVHVENNDAQVLGAALGIAKDLYRVNMDEKQNARAAQLTQSKYDAEAAKANEVARVKAEEDKYKKGQDEVSFLKDWAPSKSPYAVRIPGRDGTYEPRSDIQTREKAAKEKDASLAQNKQSGLAEMGLLAEEQYKKATTGDGSYNPTESWQPIDSSSWAPNWAKDNKAIEANAAMDSWVESFLRDASGAAIPATERGPYKELYFPVAGDSPQAVANKAALRQQKMSNALVAGGSKPDAALEKTGSKKEETLLDRAIAEKQKRLKTQGTAGK